MHFSADLLIGERMEEMLVKTSDYRKLPACLNHGGGFGKSKDPKEGFAPPEGFSPPPGMMEMMALEEEKKIARKPLAALFRAGTATYGKVTLPYRYYVPENLEEGKKYPLVLFLHGGGERGTDNEVQLLANDGAVVWVRDQQEGGEPCFVLAPQCPEEGPGWLENHLLAASQALDDMISEYPIDENRLYVTGMSMGGGGSWRINCMYPDRFAAVVPLCSACCLDETGKAVDPDAIEAVAEAFLDKPLWIFHAADDAVVMPEISQALVRALEEKGKKRGEDFFYTEYPAECGYNHGCWGPAYEWKLMRQWLLQQNLAPAPLFGPPEGAEMPFPMMDMEEMEKIQAAEKAARMVWRDRFIAGKASSPDVTVPYLLYTPEVSEPVPLVVMLHGIGGCGADNLGQLVDNDALMHWIAGQDEGKIEPCFVLAPQCPLPIPNTRWELEYLELVKQAVDGLLEQYPIDSKRIYIAGLSLGGYGVWNLNRMYPDTFAAVVSCCAACLIGQMPRNRIDYEMLAACAGPLVNKPLWMFHAEDDMAVPVETTKTMAKQLKEAGKTDLHLTIYPAELHYNHGCWDHAFTDPDMRSWLFQQHL